MLTVPGTACPCAQAVGAQSLTTSSVQTGQLAAALSRPPAAFPSQHAHIARQPGAPHLWCPWPFDQVRIQYLLPPVQTLRIGAPIKVLGDAHPVLAIVFLHSMAEQSVLSSTPSVRAMHQAGGHMHPDSLTSSAVHRVFDLLFFMTGWMGAGWSMAASDAWSNSRGVMPPRRM